MMRCWTLFFSAVFITACRGSGQGSGETDEFVPFTTIDALDRFDLAESLLDVLQPAMFNSTMLERPEAPITATQMLHTILGTVRLNPRPEKQGGIP
jgi:hypothetical protein